MWVSFLGGLDYKGGLVRGIKGLQCQLTWARMGTTPSSMRVFCGWCSLLWVSLVHTIGGRCDT